MAFDHIKQCINRLRLLVPCGIALMVLFAAVLGSLAAEGDSMKQPALYRLKIDGSFPEPFFPKDNQLTEEGVELGRRLFFDKALSRNKQVSCASCHKAAAAFSDSTSGSIGIGPEATRRNSMPLFNLAWRRGLFWDGAHYHYPRTGHPSPD